MQLKSWPLLLLLTLGLGLVLWLHRDYGVSYDEEVHLRYGDWIMAWYASGGKVDSAVTAISCKYYGGFVDTVMQAVTNTATMLGSWDHYQVRHLLNALIGLLGVFFTYRLGELLGGRWVGFLAGLFLFLTPRWFGHTFDNPKDVPFAVAYVATLYYLAVPLVRGTGYGWGDAVKIGLAIGAALGTRIGGVFLYVYLVGALAWWVWSGASQRGRRAARAVGVGLLVGGISWSFMLLFWPYAQAAPFTRPFEVMHYMGQNPWGGSVFFQGELIPAASLPRSYLPTWLLISLPEFYLLAPLCAVFFWRQWSRKGAQWVLPALIIGAVLFPVGVILYKKSPLYDGMRHVLFLLPPLAVLAARAWLLIPRRTMLVGLSVCLIMVLYDLVTLHPYQTCYFNRLIAGGLAQAGKKFDTDYWGQSYQAGAEWILKKYPTESFHIAVPFMAKRLDYYFDRPQAIADRREMLLSTLRGKFKMPQPRELRLQPVGPDWHSDDFNQGNYALFMANSQFRDIEKIAGSKLFTVERQGVRLLTIKEPPQVTPPLP